MNRRQLLTVSAAVPMGGALAALAAHIGEHTVFTRFFFDHRFDDAHRAAGRLDGTVAVDGDITELWAGGLRSLLQSRPVTLGGLTAESFHFCLRILATDAAHILRNSCERVSPDLYLWSLQTTPRNLEPSV